jgi:hypothetical protein
MFGNLASNPNPTPATGGSTFGLSPSTLRPGALTGSQSGAFGGNNNNPSMFSNAKPTTGFGAFGGGTSAFNSGGGGTFGSTNPSQPATSNTGLFGQPNATGSAFGGNTFANKPATSAFVSTTRMSSGDFPNLNNHLLFLRSESECRALRWHSSYYNWDIESCLQCLLRERSRILKLDSTISEYHLHASVSW